VVTPVFLLPMPVSPPLSRPQQPPSPQTGKVNVAPYSYFNIMGHAPPVFCLGINRSPGRGGGKKDTLSNIEATG